MDLFQISWVISYISSSTKQGKVADSQYLMARKFERRGN